MVNKLHCSTQNRLNELKTLLDDKKAQIKSLMEKTSDVRRMKEGLQNNLLLEEEIKLKPVIAFDCGMGFHPDTPLNEYKQFSVCWLFRLATEKKLELVQTAKKLVEKEAEEKKKETYSKLEFEDYMKLYVCQTFEGRQGDGFFPQKEFLELCSATVNGSSTRSCRAASCLVSMRYP